MRERVTELGGELVVEANLPAAVEVACYRIVTEALTNVAKHANHRAAGWGSRPSTW